MGIYAAAKFTALQPKKIFNKKAAPAKIVGAPPSTSSRALIRGPDSDNATLAKEDTCSCHAAISDKAKEKRGNREVSLEISPPRAEALP